MEPSYSIRTLAPIACLYLPQTLVEGFNDANKSQPNTPYDTSNFTQSYFITGVTSSNNANGSINRYSTRTRRLLSQKMEVPPVLSICGVPAPSTVSTVAVQFRGTGGIVTFHCSAAEASSSEDVEGSSPPPPLLTGSMTFCKISLGTSTGGGRLLVLGPGEDDGVWCLWELQDEEWVKVYQSSKGNEGRGGFDKLGMTTSLSLLPALTEHVVVVSGHEGGFVGVHVLKVGGDGWEVLSSKSVRPLEVLRDREVGEGGIDEKNRGNTDPVLTLDTRWVREGEERGDRIRIVAGFAGSQEDIEEIRDRNGGRGGTVGMLEASFEVGDGEGRVIKAVECKSMLKTCKVGKEGKGKVGVNAVKFNKTGDEFVVGGWDGRVRVFGWDRGRKPIKVGRGHDGAVRDVGWNEEGGLVSVGEDGKIVVWR